MMVFCKCEKWHSISPTGMALIIDAYAAGELQVVTKEGVRSRCLLRAFTPDRLTVFRRRYKKNAITVDGDDAVWDATAEEVSRHVTA